MQPSKTGFLYVFDRVTGEPVWPIEERPVPQSTVPGEHTAATQPFPTRPAPFARHGITPDDLIDFPGLGASARVRWPIRSSSARSSPRPRSSATSRAARRGR